MGDYMVVKKFNPNDPDEWDLEPFIYRDDQEAGLLAEGKVPGEDFIKVTDEGTPEGAKRQAAAYLNGTHKAPGVIDSWVRSVGSS